MRKRQPLRVRLLGAGPLYESVRTSLPAFGCEAYLANDRTRKRLDLLVLAGETRIIPRAERDRYRLGAVCFHPSLLPRHRGRDAVYWTIEQGDTITGATWFWLDDGIDTGPIAIQRGLPRALPLSITRGGLYYDHLVPLGEVLFGELMARLVAGEVPSVPQDDAYATYEPPRPRRMPVAS